jgi:hypothetical protein
MKKIFLILTFVLGPIGFAMSQDASASIADLKVEIAALQKEMGLQKREVAVQIQEYQSSNTVNTIAHVAAILLAIVSGPLSVAVRSRIDRKRLDAIVDEKLKAHMENAFPGIAKKTIDEYLNKHVPARVDTITGAADVHENETRLKATTPILVMAQNLTLANDRAEYLRKLGYKDLRPVTPAKYSELPPHAICFIEHPGKEDSYPQLNNRYIQALINDFSSLNPPKKGLFFYFGSKCEGLNFAVLEKKGMCNMESTIDRNLFGLIKQLESHKS